MGGDVSKGYCDFIVLDEEEKVFEENFQLDDTFSGHHELKGFFKNFFLKNPESELYAGFESTGGYENNWINLLRELSSEHKLHVVRINPKAVYHQRETDLKRVVTDKVSALIIAEYLISKKRKIKFDQDDTYAELKRQWKFIRLLKKQRVQLVNHLESLVYNAHPQLLSYWQGDLPNWLLLLISKYPTARKLSKAAVGEVSQIPYISKEKAKTLIDESKRSVASATSSGYEVLLSSLALKILDTEKLINIQIQVMVESFDFEEIEILKSFGGISDYSAFGLMIEIVNIKRYKSLKSLTAFFGLNPAFKESGDGQIVPRMSKQGRKEPRALLFNIAMSAIVHNEYIRDLYESYCERKESRLAVIGIIMHKILRIVYGMLKNRERYNPDIDKRNRKKKIQCKPNKENKRDRIRRYHQYDKDAPISKRNARKRKEQEASQNGLAIEYEIDPPTHKNDNINLINIQEEINDVEN